ncbi:cytochrome c3 family protein [Desulfolithobacter sp.]
MMRHKICWAVFVLMAIPIVAGARVTGPCVNCHTMHNSQNNFPVTDNTSPNSALLVSDCVGCHTGTNNGLNDTPYVFDTNPPMYGVTGTETTANTLAGGNFYWVASAGTLVDDRFGHNVSGITAPDATLTQPPGGDGTFNTQLRCAGTSGCHGRQATSDQVSSMKGGHHYKDHTIWQDGTTLAKSYRFLESIQGLGDPAYEFHPDYLQHNKYYGRDRTSETDQAPGTISSLCARCHRNFHDGSGSVASATTFGTGVWLRHPTDFDMSGAMSSTEYRQYNGGSGTNNLYSVISPVATEDTSTTLNTTVFTTPNDAVVMCLSCHRAHGTPYSGILRWDYKAWPAAGFNGCAVCHTTKD